MPRELLLSPAAPALVHLASAPALVDLQAYLSRFGWLRLPGQRAVIELHDELPAAALGRLDEATTTALADFQLFHHLPVTGRIDAATVALMRRPRCPLADRAPSAATEGCAGGHEHFPQAVVERAARRAYRIWCGAVPMAWRPVLRSPALDLRLVCDRDAQPAAADLDSLVLHAVGHALGLGHSSDAGAVMHAYHHGTRRRLSDSDIAAIRAINGKPGRCCRRSDG